MAPLDHSFDWTSTTKEAFMLTSLVAEKTSGQWLRQRLAQMRGFRWWKRRAWGAVAQAEHHPMAKSNSVDETRIADPVEPAKRQPRATVKKARKLAKAQKRRTRRRMSLAVATVPNLQAANRPNSRHASTCSVAGKVQRLRTWNRPPAGRNTVCAASWPGRSKRSSASHWYRRSPMRGPAAIASQTRPERHGPECVGGAQRAPKARR